MMIPNKPLQSAPSWPQAQAAKAAWNKIRVSSATDQDKRAAAEAYKIAMRKCMREVGHTPR